MLAICAIDIFVSLVLVKKKFKYASGKKLGYRTLD